MADRDLSLVVKAITDRASFENQRREIRKTATEVERLREPVRGLDRDFRSISRARRVGLVSGGEAMGLRARAAGGAALRAAGMGRLAGLGPLGIAIGALTMAIGGLTMTINRLQRQRDTTRDLGIRPGTEAARQRNRVFLGLQREGYSDAQANQIANFVTNRALRIGRTDIAAFADERMEMLRNMDPVIRRQAAPWLLGGAAGATLPDDFRFNVRRRGETGTSTIGETFRSMKSELNGVIDETFFSAPPAGAL